MNDKLSPKQTDAILKALNEAIETGPWDKSNFLKAIGKNLVGIRNDFLNLLNKNTISSKKTDSDNIHGGGLKTGQQEVYISLYSTDGANIHSWEKIVNNLPQQLISRPIYANEEDIKAVIRLKENKRNEAYVAVYVNQTDLLTLSKDRISLDKLGKPLLSLKNKVLNLDNISRFVHLTGTYDLKYGRLIKL